MIIRGDILQGKTRKKIKGAQPQDNTYGGFKYRINYDNFLRENSKKTEKSRRKTLYIASSSAFAVCIVALLLVVLYDRGVFGVSGTPIPAITIDERKYDSTDFGDFVCESVSGEVVDIYHLPPGVVLTYVSVNPNYHYNDNKLFKGDIITAIDGMQITGADEFREYVKQQEAGYLAKLDVYRKGELINLSYVFN